MRRREFIGLVGGAAVWPLTSRAQQAMPVVGYLGQLSLETAPPSVAAFRQGLNEAGFVEGRNVGMEYRWARGDISRLPELAAELVRRRVSVIATPGSTFASLAAKAATTTIPIVFTTALDPVEIGLVTSLNQPAGNITGITDMSAELMPKRIGVLRELIPRAQRFAILVHRSGAGVESIVKDAQVSGSAVGLKIEILYVGTKQEIDSAFDDVRQKRIDALLIHTNPFLGSARAQIIALAARHGVPIIYPTRDYAEMGGLMSYGSNAAERNRRAGVYVGRILKGERPADLPVLRPTKFELVINLKTAGALGIDVPPMLRALADEVIE
jgi:putative ABC transport system substrate-binding protein